MHLTICCLGVACRERQQPVLLEQIIEKAHTPGDTLWRAATIGIGWGCGATGSLMWWIDVSTHPSSNNRRNGSCCAPLKNLCQKKKLCRWKKKGAKMDFVCCCLPSTWLSFFLFLWARGWLHGWLDHVSLSSLPRSHASYIWSAHRRRKGAAVVAYSCVCFYTSSFEFIYYSSMRADGGRKSWGLPFFLYFLFIPPPSSL
jgi:hypothetical protein